MAAGSSGDGGHGPGRGTPAPERPIRRAAAPDQQRPPGATRAPARQRQRQGPHHHGLAGAPAYCVVAQHGGSRRAGPWPARPPAGTPNGVCRGSSSVAVSSGAARPAPGRAIRCPIPRHSSPDPGAAAWSAERRGPTRRSTRAAGVRAPVRLTRGPSGERVEVSGQGAARRGSSAEALQEDGPVGAVAVHGPSRGASSARARLPRRGAITTRRSAPSPTLNVSIPAASSGRRARCGVRRS